MPAGQTTKQCKDCKRRARASADTRWCDRCGGELTQAKFGSGKRRRRDTPR